MMTERVPITGLTAEELADFVAGHGEPRYRARQIFKGLYERRLRSFDEMTDLPKAFREKLDTIAAPATISVESKYVSEDGTRRFLMKTADGLPVEAVFIPTENRDTICFSSQSGCPLKCDFCLTAKLGLLRNLTPGEIVEQIVVVLNDVYGVDTETPHGTNLVAMGAGEPFLNFENLIKAITVMSDEQGLFIVPGRITVSTAGIVPKIHELMGAAKKLERSLKRGERFTFEYVLLGGVNDTDGQAHQLADLLEKYDLRRVKINLIPHNPAEQLDYHPPDELQVESFKRVLESRGVSAYVRRPRGRDIYAACGQLAAKEEPNLVQITSGARAA